MKFYFRKKLAVRWLSLVCIYAFFILLFFGEEGDFAQEIKNRLLVMANIFALPALICGVLYITHIKPFLRCRNLLERSCYEHATDDLHPEEKLFVPNPTIHFGSFSFLSEKDWIILPYDFIKYSVFFPEEQNKLIQPKNTLLKTKDSKLYTLTLRETEYETLTERIHEHSPAFESGKQEGSLFSALVKIKFQAVLIFFFGVVLPILVIVLRLVLQVLFERAINLLAVPF